MANGQGGMDAGRYLAELKKRSKESRVHRQFQLTGLMIADLLGDRAHKSLYIKLAKQRNPHELLRIAKEVAEKKDVRRKGAYFMAIVSGTARPGGAREVFRFVPAKRPKPARRAKTPPKKKHGKSRKNAS